ncbi:M14 family zinc carboxypeptidase [Pseudoalteromonas sp. B160]|uniref:M14 family zinc carboxypeptidase n=1 Tax=Pseudoalteromonas sp. B160 TaxID=630414 RepID=UPI00301C4DEF
MIRKTILVGLLSYSFSLTAAPIAMHQIKGLNKAAITHADLAPLLDTLAAHPSIERKNLGQSFLGKSIDAFYIGSGPIKVMMWSQMHGDENTASAALTDFLSYAIETKNDAWRENWQNKLSLMIIPMVNPDGAQLQTRFNAQGIDLNRDAKAWS